MKKFIVSLMVLGLALMATSALAEGLGPNELTNGNFATDLTGWSTLDGHATFTVFSPNAFTHYAGSNTHSDSEYGIYQIIDESQTPGWLPDGTAKNWRVDLDYALAGSAGAELHILYWPTNGGSAPTLTEVGDTFPGWTNLLSVGFSNTDGVFTHYTESGTVEELQPQWIAYVLEGSVDAIPPATGSFYFANNDFEAQCVPLPPSVWLLGSGLLGLLGFRRKFGK
ncbi:MAG: hypothetical protein WCD80_06510 [Desulfobaccales bacterium]